MAEVKKLESLRIDLKDGVAEVQVNGVSISSTGKYLNVTFENGEWSLMTTEDNFYSTNDNGETE